MIGDTLCRHCDSKWRIAYINERLRTRSALKRLLQAKVAHQETIDDLLAEVDAHAADLRRFERSSAPEPDPNPDAERHQP